MSNLRTLVQSLGGHLGDTIRRDAGDDGLNLIESIRKQGKRISRGDTEQLQALSTEIQNADDDKLLLIARSFSQFLNLANIAEQVHSTSQEGTAEQKFADAYGDLNEEFSAKKFNAEQFQSAIKKLSIDLVLTAHPTEITRRTLIHKHREIADQLNKGSADSERRVVELISQSWHTNSIRAERPTPVDEASWGISVIEDSLWDALPAFMRQLDTFSEQLSGQPLAADLAPVTISSWMGGDRDGNPNVTARITEKVLAMSRAKACQLYANDLDALSMELSMNEASPELVATLGEHVSEHPYRDVLRPLRKKLRHTQEQMQGLFDGSLQRSEGELIESLAQLLEPLELCARSLSEQGLDFIARGRLLDSIRRVRTFGIALIKLDIRQHSERHSDVIGELTLHLGLGDYRDWNEEQRQEFLLRELANPRPLTPKHWPTSADVREVLDTIEVIARQPRELLSTYVISMAAQPSDVLLVELLLQEAGVSWPMPVAPLFETLDDLDRAESVMAKLLSIDWYQKRLRSSDNRQTVMIGYSDSAKDAGVLAAAWAQYRAQDQLIKLHKKAGVELTLFHGRGGTIGRGGAPAHTAILSQPPGSVDGGLRVTEQGETIRYKFGVPDLAVRSLSLYASAILEALLLPPPEPEAKWREIMDVMAEQSCAGYRAIVCDEPDFVRYFRQATPEQELGQLPLGSRPAKRKADGGIESLRAIPWIFSWAQNRLVLPSWLGFGEAFAPMLEGENRATLDEMYQQWPFFAARINMMEMLFSKSSADIAKLYDQRLVEPELHRLGDQLRSQLERDSQLLLSFLGQEQLLEHEGASKRSMAIRHGYLVPLHLVQIELLARSRKEPFDSGVDLHSHARSRALMVAIGGIAAGLRNTG